MLLRELIDIPTRVHQGDFVLRLVEGVASPEDTLASYVVTEQLSRAFDTTLGLIRAAHEERSSKGAYLHGSFGSGKSHFMAVLSLLLQGHPAVRERPDLAPVVARHDEWLRGRRFLVVPYHMIGATSMEAAVLGGYARHVRALHPDAPVPAVYSSGPVFANAADIRARMGDDAFFAQLGADASEDDEWGTLAAGWDATRFEAAIASAPGDEEHDALLSALIGSLFPALEGFASGSGFVSIDEGLSAISRHAKDLGYDGLVLFLDELVLWLASQMGNTSFISRESQKVPKLVEAQIAERPIPIVSFIARQRDLRELVGEHMPGAEQLGVADVLKYWEGRFATVTLEDRNLPEIAERRILKPVNEDARARIEEAFRTTEKVRGEVWRTLLTSDADRALFRRTYPFSPAFMKALIGVSSALQRERTALKVMVQLLVTQRDELRLGDLVPVGDLYDIIASGDEPFSDAMRAQFQAARRLYATKLRPQLLQDHGLQEDQAHELAPSHPVRTDDRLMKTLLLAALVPEVEPLRNITAERLAALNHGTITAPIPGEERTIVLQKARDWASQLVEVKVGEGDDPTISLQLQGVDVESILEQALNVDTDGERRRRVRAMVLDALGVADADRLMLEYRLDWRGTQRSIDLVFANVRSATELPDANLAAEPGRWKLVIDFPFDDTPDDGERDRARLERYRAHHPSTQTVCWLPAHFTPQTTRDLGRLVVLEHVLSGDRFHGYAAHLAPADQTLARQQLEAQRGTLLIRVRQALEQAYGIANAREGVVDTGVSQDELFFSLEHAFTPRPPVAPDLRAGTEALAGQMLAHQYPAHPEFDGRITTGDLAKVHAELVRATRAEHGRIEIADRPLRTLLRRIANPLRLGTMHENHFVLSDHWPQHVVQQRGRAAQRGEDDALTVARLRDWLDQPEPMGLPREVQSLVILVLAEQTNRSFRAHGGPVVPTLARLDDHLELVDQELPSAEDWELAGRRAASIFGLNPRPLLNASNARELADALVQAATAARGPAADAAARLDDHAAQLGCDEGSDRRRTAHAAAALLGAIARADGSPVDVLRALAKADVPTTEEALGRAISSAGELAAALSSARWDLIDALARVGGDGNDEAAAALSHLQEVARADEFARPLVEDVRAAERTSVRLLTPVKPPRPGTKERANLTVEEAIKLLSGLGTRARVELIRWTEPASSE